MKSSEEVNSYQVAGSHYNLEGTLQLWDFVSINKLGYVEGNIVKYITRWKKKNGIQDVEKSLHYLEKLYQLLKDGILDLPMPRDPKGLDIYKKENELSDIEYTVFYLLFTYTTLDELYRAWVLLRYHILAPARGEYDVSKV